MKRILIVFLLGLGVACGTATAQQSCTQTLRLANSSYDQGRLHELPGLLKGCLQSSDGFTKAEKVTAYKLLVLSYIYLEEPKQADSTMILLLEADHFFEPNQALDPGEFIGLYNTFRNKPVFNVGIKLGINFTLPSVSSNYYIGNNSLGAGTYTPSLGIQGGFVFEKGLFQNWKNQKWKKFTLAPEILFVSRAISYDNSPFTNYLGSNPDTNTLLKVSESQGWLDLNVLVQYQLKPASKLNPYVALGPGVSYLLSSSSSPTTTRGNTGNVVSGPPVDLTNSYKKLVYSITASTGIKYRFGGLYATLEIRYQYGLSNLVNPDKRYNKEFSFDYVGGLNDYSIQNLQVMAGAVVPIFKPQKLKRKK